VELAVIWAWIVANDAALLSILLFLVSDVWGANSKWKSNGFLSFVIIQLESFAKKRGAIDLTPEDK
jgi:hypothetical protein